MNHLFLPGVSGNYVSTPDSNSLDITGDIDLRAYIQADSYRYIAQKKIIGKRSNSNRSYALIIRDTGTLAFIHAEAAAPDTDITAISSAAISFNGGTAIWIRTTLDVDNGAGGNDVNFYTSTDGVTWNLLGVTQTVAGTTNIYAGTSTLRVGTDDFNTQFFPGKIFYAEVRNGINGTIVANPDFRANISSGFTDSVGNVWTVSTSGSPAAALVKRSTSALRRPTTLPSEVGTLAAWYSTSALSGTDGTAISRWNDLSGNSFHIVQATGSLQPILKTNIINGFPAVKFDGSDDGLWYNGQIAPTGDITILAVGKYITFGNGRILTQRNGNNGYILATNSTPNMRFLTGNGASLDTAAASFTEVAGTPYIFHGDYSNINTRASISGKTIASTANATRTAGTNVFSVGGETTDGASFSSTIDGYIAEVIVWSTLLTDNERNLMLQYLASKYAITLG